MISLKGYVKGNAVVADGFIGNIYDGKEVIVTILDSFRSKKKKAAAKKRYTAERKTQRPLLACGKIIPSQRTFLNMSAR